MAARKGPTNKEMQIVRCYVAKNYSEKATAAELGMSVPSIRRVVRAKIVQPFLRCLQKGAAQRFEHTEDDVLREAGYIAWANQQDYYHLDKDGHIEWDLRGLTRDQAAAIEEIETKEIEIEGEDGKPKTVRKITSIKLWDKRQGLETFFKHFGLHQRDNEQQRSIAPIITIIVPQLPPPFPGDTLPPVETKHIISADVTPQNESSPTQRIDS